MSMIDTPLMRGLERVLDLSAFRHQVIAANLANIDTPGYRTRDLRPFAGEIEQAMAGGEPAFAQPSFTPVAHEIRGLLSVPTAITSRSSASHCCSRRTSCAFRWRCNS